MSTLPPDIARTEVPSRLSGLLGRGAVLRRMSRWPSVFGVGLIVLVGACAPVITRYSPTTPHPAKKLLPPSAAHWLGTDPLGMDIFTRTIYSIRVDLSLALLAVILGIAWGAPLGALAAHLGGVADRFLSRLSESIQAFPQVLFGMVLVAALGGGVTNLIIIIAVVNVPVYLMMVRSAALPLRSADFVDAARCAGASRARIIVRYVLPNALVPVFSQFSLSCAYAIQLIAGLSFIGVGIRPPTPEWGAMINEGAPYIVSGQWWPSIVPGIALLLSVVSLTRLSADVRLATMGRLTAG